MAESEDVELTSLHKQKNTCTCGIVLTENYPETQHKDNYTTQAVRMIYTELSRKKRNSRDLCSWEGLKRKGDNIDGDMSWRVGDSSHISSPRVQ